MSPCSTCRRSARASAAFCRAVVRAERLMPSELGANVEGSRSSALFPHRGHAGALPERTNASNSCEQPRHRKSKSGMTVRRQLNAVSLPACQNAAIHMRRVLAVLVLCSTVAGCLAREPPPAREVRGHLVERTRTSMGSDVHFTAWTADEPAALAAF